MRLAAQIIGIIAVVTISRAADASFDKASASVQSDLRVAKQDLTELNRTIAAEKLPLARRVADLESSTATKRGELTKAQKEAFDASASIGGFESELKTADQEVEFVTSSLAEFGHFLETKVHISELRDYEPLIEQAESAANDVNLSGRERLDQQLALLDKAADRIGDLMGGQTFSGQALSAEVSWIKDTLHWPGRSRCLPVCERQPGIAQLGEHHGRSRHSAAWQRPNQLAELAQTGKGCFSRCHRWRVRIAEREETLTEHLQGWRGDDSDTGSRGTGGLLGIAKWAQVAFLRAPLPQDVELILKQMATDQKTKARDHARSLKGPAGNLLETAIDNAHQKKELLEEMLYERVLHIRPRLERWLPFIGLTAAIAPLLGLLGTVTGMINTFKLITLFGSGDAKTLSSGISEALVTTGADSLCGCSVARSCRAHSSHSRLYHQSRTSRGRIRQRPCPERDDQ